MRVEVSPFGGFKGLREKFPEFKMHPFLKLSIKLLLIIDK
jgi:hypothetical protein